MLVLSTYLGHSKVAHTYWYLEAVPELMRDIADHTEQYAYGTGSMTMTANSGNLQRKQQSNRSDGSRPATRTPIASHVTAFFEQRLPIERRASENTRDS
jgi:hypothetical protein